jgi:DNA-binding response OmpR family regulator
MTDQRRLLLIDDDETLRASLVEQLTAEYDVSQEETGTAGFNRASAERFDVILLDHGLPDIAGREVCRRLRAAGMRTPIIMLTAAASETDMIAGLDAGANDYLVKPFRLGELLARVRAQLRQHEASQDASFAVGPFTFLPGSKMLVEQVKNRKVRLTDKETQILRYLCRARDQVISRETLLGEVWGYNAGVNTHTLETHIYRLRQKLESDPANAELLVTGPGGYRLAR